MQCGPLTFGLIKARKVRIKLMTKSMAAFSLGEPDERNKGSNIV